MSARLMILNGPNLNLLGVREPHIYGSTTLAAIEASCAAFAEYIGASLTFEQSNHEGHLVDLIQSARQSSDAIIINPAGYSKLSSAVKGVICGLGPYGYIVAMQAAARMLDTLPAALPAPIRIGPQ